MGATFTEELELAEMRPILHSTELLTRRWRGGQYDLQREQISFLCMAEALFLALNLRRLALLVVGM